MKTKFRKGNQVLCYGEGDDVFTIDMIMDNRAFLMSTRYGSEKCHGWEKLESLVKVTTRTHNIFLIKKATLKGKR